MSGDQEVKASDGPETPEQTAAKAQANVTRLSEQVTWEREKIKAAQERLRELNTQLDQWKRISKSLQKRTYKPKPAPEPEPIVQAAPAAPPFRPDPDRVGNL